MMKLCWPSEGGGFPLMKISIEHLNSSHWKALGACGYWGLVTLGDAGLLFIKHSLIRTYVPWFNTLISQIPFRSSSNKIANFSIYQYIQYIIIWWLYIDSLFFPSISFCSFPLWTALRVRLSEQGNGDTRRSHTSPCLDGYYLPQDLLWMKSILQLFQWTKSTASLGACWGMWPEEKSAIPYGWGDDCELG